jgi:hypothetical protein
MEDLIHGIHPFSGSAIDIALNLGLARVEGVVRHSPTLVRRFLHTSDRADARHIGSCANIRLTPRFAALQIELYQLELHFDGLFDAAHFDFGEAA